MTFRQSICCLRSLATALLLTFTFTAWVPTAGAHALSVDTTTVDTSLLHPDSGASSSSWCGPLIAGSALTTFGAWGASSPWGHCIDRNVRHMMYAHRGRQAARIAGDIIEFVPLGALLLLEPAGVPARHDLSSRVMEGVTGVLVAEVVVQTTKRIVKRERPDGSDRHSWPSGHTAIAFVGAELCRQEYGNGYGAAAYGVAALTGWLRLRADRHWFTDVAGGAGIGILSAQAARWLLPVEQRLFRLPRRSAAPAGVTTAHSNNGTTIAVVPFGGIDYAGIAAAVTF